MIRSLLRRVLLELRQFWIHLVPRLRVRRPDFLLRFIQGRIVQSPGSYALPEVGLSAEQSRTAFRAKTALIVSHRIARCIVITRRTFRDLEGFRRHVENGSVCPARHQLTIAAMTIEHHDRFRADFVTNRAARASAAKFSRHGLLSTTFTPKQGKGGSTPCRAVARRRRINYQLMLSSG